MRDHKTFPRLVSLAAIAAIVLLVLCATPLLLTAQAPAQPDIKITEIPPSAPGGPNEMFPISGEVTNLPGKDTKDYHVVIYVYAGGQWFVQPFDYAPLTEIKSSGKFETETHGGSIYAALLVKGKYPAKATIGALPEVGGDVIARVRVAGKKEN